MISVTINSGIRKFSELNRHDTKPDDLSKYKKVEVGDIAYNSMRMWQGASGYSPYSGILSPAYTVISPKNGVSSRFFSYVLKQPRMIHLFEINSQGLTKDTWNLKYPAFAPIETVAPKTYEEQEKISGVLVKIDELITLHQRKEIMIISLKTKIKLLKKVANDWEQRKLGEIVERVVRKNINNESDLPLTISAQYGLVDQNTYFNNRVASRDVSNYYLVYNGEFAYNKSTSDGFPFGAVKRLDLYEKGVLSTLYIVFGLKNRNQVNSNYLTVFFDTDRWHKGVAERAAEGARNHGLLNISVDDFFDLNIKLPKDFSEQELLGRVFNNLDKLITLHQRKDFYHGKENEFVCMNSKDVKMTNDWEQRKVKDVANRYDNLRIPVAANLRKKGSTPYYGANGIQDYVDGYTHNGEFVLVAEDGANDLKNYPVKCVKGKIWVNNHAHVLQTIPEIADNMFLAFSINQADIESLLVGGGRAKLNAEVLMGIELKFPSKVEQKKIGEYIHNIDKLITLHQRKGTKKYAKKAVHKKEIISNKLPNDWEQRKLGETVQIIMGQSPDGSTYSEKPSDYILVQGNADLENGWVKPRVWTTQKTKFGNAGDLIMSVRAPAGSMGKTAYNVVLGRGVAAIKGNEFIYQLLVKKDLDGYWKRLSAGSTFESLNSETIFNAEICEPIKAEQEKIGAYFETLDKLITLHRCKEFYKKDEKMFMLHHSKFKRKTNAWEQRKLGELVKEVNRTDAESTAPIMMITAENGFINQSERYAFNNAGESLKKYILLKKGELAYNHGASKIRPFGSCFALKTAESARIPFVYHCFSAENSVAEFLSIELNGHNVENQLRRIVSSGARMDGLLNISFVEYVSVDLTLPNKDEQAQIANCFERLDKLITLHQRE